MVTPAVFKFDALIAVTPAPEISTLPVFPSIETVVNVVPSSCAVVALSCISIVVPPTKEADVNALTTAVAPTWTEPAPVVTDKESPPPIISTLLAPVADNVMSVVAAAVTVC